VTLTAVAPSTTAQLYRSSGSGRDASRSRRHGIQLAVVKPPAADAGVRTSSAAGGLTPLGAAAGRGRREKNAVCAVNDLSETRVLCWFCLTLVSFVYLIY